MLLFALEKRGMMVLAKQDETAEFKSGVTVCRLVFAQRTTVCKIVSLRGDDSPPPPHRGSSEVLRYPKAASRVEMTT